MLTPWQGVKVVEIASGIAGRVAGGLMADLGAEVLRILPPRDRALERLPAARHWNRSVRPRRLDLRSSQDRAILAEQLAAADVALVNLAPAAMDRLGLQSDRLRAAQPRLVHCAITGYGLRGPYRDEPAWDAMVAARAGVLGNQPGFRDGPTYLMIPFCSYGAALLALQGIGAALLRQRQNGQGAAVETSLFQGGLITQLYALVKAEGVTPLVPSDPRGSGPCIRSYRCADGRWLFVSASAPVYWAKLAIALGLEDLVAEPRFATAPFLADPRVGAELESILATRLAERPAPEWQAILEAHDVPAAQVQDYAALRKDPQLRANGTLAGQDREIAQGLPVRVEPLEVAADENSRGVAEIDRDSRPPKGTLPLSGLRVLDLSTQIAGPMCARYLVDLGASVIKLEAPVGDSLRLLGGSFLSWNWGKRGMVVDITRAEGRQIALELVRRCDVLIHNWRPTVANRLGMASETLSQLNPGMVYCSITGYGERGPEANKPAWDPIIQARGGMMQVQGGAGNPPNYIYGSPTDYYSAGLAAAAILAALYRRQDSGQGATVATSLLDAGAFAMQAWLADSGQTPTVNDPGQMGPNPFYRLYQARDGWIFLANPRLATSDEAHAGGILQKLGPETDVSATIVDSLKDRYLSDIQRSATETGIAVAPVLAGRHTQIFSDPQLRRLNGTAHVIHPVFGDVEQIGPLVRLEGEPEQAHSAAPLLGQHTREILIELDYRENQISEWERKGVVVNTKPDRL